MPDAGTSVVERAGNRGGVRVAWLAGGTPGSHIILTKTGHIAPLSVPDHKEVAKATLRSLIRSLD